MAFRGQRVGKRRGASAEIPAAGRVSVAGWALAAASLGLIALSAAPLLALDPPEEPARAAKPSPAETQTPEAKKAPPSPAPRAERKAGRKGNRASGAPEEVPPGTAVDFPVDI